MGAARHFLCTEHLEAALEAVADGGGSDSLGSLRHARFHKP